MSRQVIPVSQEQVPEHLRTNRSAFTRWFGRTFYRAIGWNLEGNIADAERVMIVAAPSHVQLGFCVWHRRYSGYQCPRALAGQT